MSYLNIEYIKCHCDKQNIFNYNYEDAPGITIII